MFEGVLAVAPACAVCGLDLAGHDAGDGPAVFVILVLGFAVVGLAIAVEVAYEPPLWVHAVLWIPFVLAGSILLLRVFKATLLALQYRHRADTLGGGDG